VREFTALTERRTGRDVVSLLNEYLEQMVEPSSTDAAIRFPAVSLTAYPSTSKA
jgi:hypothetical protein